MRAPTEPGPQQGRIARPPSRRPRPLSPALARRRAGSSPASWRCSSLAARRLVVRRRARPRRPPPRHAREGRGGKGDAKKAAKGGGRFGVDPSRVQPVAAAAARKGDIGIVQTALGTVTALRTVTVKPRVDGQLLRVLFDEGQLREGRATSLAQIDPVPLPGGARPGRGHARARRGAAQQRAPRPRALPHAARAGLDRAAAGRRAGRARAPARGHGQGEPARRWTTPSCSSRTRASRRRSPGASGCAWSTPGNMVRGSRRRRPRRHHAGRSDLGGLHHPAGHAAARARAPERRRQAGGRGVGPRAEEPARHGAARHHRQPDRRRPPAP